MVSLTQSSRAASGRFRPPLAAGGSVDAGDFRWNRAFSRPGVAFR
jgi:hypothetical protein